jgi:anthranilate phosphoribosyltransferase
VNINIPPEKVKESIEKIGIGFLFAPNFHKAFKNVQKIRQSLGFPTVFNILGPLVNPAFDASRKINVHLLGVRAPELTERMANVMKLLNMKKAWVVCGFNDDKSKTMDEMSICGETKITSLKEDGEIKTFMLMPEEVGIQCAEESELKGGAPQQNAELIKNILLGQEKSMKQKAFLLNAGAAIVVSGKAATLPEGIATAGQILRNGTAYQKVKELVEFTNQ